jgi:hypothetical protein
MAVEKLTDQALLADIAKKVKDDKAVRRAAASKRVAAVKDLTDQTLLAKIARTDKDSNMREASSDMLIDLITDQALLAEMAKTDKDSFIRLAAVKKLTDQALLADIAKTDKHYLVSGAAVKKITKYDLLVEFVMTGNDIQRAAAVEVITNEVRCGRIKVTLPPKAPGIEGMCNRCGHRALFSKCIHLDERTISQDLSCIRGRYVCPSCGRDF